MKGYELQTWTGLKVISFVFNKWEDAWPNYRLMDSPKRLINRERRTVIDEHDWRF